MTKPKTIWNYSLETEADRIIQAATQTSQRFYQKYGFFVLPRLIPTKANTVFLPNLDFNKIKGFWKTVEKAKLDIPMPVPEKIRQEVEQLLKIETEIEKEKERNKEIEKLRNDWQAKEMAFWKIVFELFPDLSKKQIELEIRPTNFGSKCSFNFVRIKGSKERKVRVKIYIRLDMPPGQIAEAILSSLFKLALEDESYGWEETEGVIDFLLKFTQLSKIFPDYQPTLKSIRSKENAQLALASQKYLRELGIPTGQIFSLKENKVLIDQKRPKQRFSACEEKVLSWLVASKNHLCSFDQIGDLIWEERADEVFSVWAISKIIQRIRNKLQTNGVSPAVIQAQRGQGYVLRD